MSSLSSSSWLFAVSGGPDSMVMLHMFLNRAKCVCHVNYHARPTADRDESIVRDFCAQNNLPFFVLNAHYTKEDGNFQNWARQVRYAFFVEMAQKHGCDAIVTGHTRDDHLETAMMQNRRGGKRLYFGIAASSSFKGCKVFRPLLDTSREGVMKYASKHHVPFGIDESNDKPSYERNRTRKHLALLTDEQRDQLLAAFAAMNAQQTSLRGEVAKLLADWRKEGLSARYFNISVRAELRPHVLYSLLSEEGIPALSSGKIDLLDNFISRGRGSTSLRLGEGYAVKKLSGQIVFSKEKQ